MADAFDALAHPARRALVDELRGAPRRAGDLGAGLGMTREAVSKHLRLLVDGGVLTVETRGRERWYALAPHGLRPVDDWLTPYRAFWTQRLDALETEIARGRRARRAAGPAAEPAIGDEHASPIQPCLLTQPDSTERPRSQGA